MNERIKQVRQAADLTQAQFAERLGLSRNFIAMIETGGRVPSDRTISDICREFGVSLAWLQFGDGEMYVKRGMSEELGLMVSSLMGEADESFRKRFISAMMELPPEFWSEFEKFLKKITEGE